MFERIIGFCLFLIVMSVIIFSVESMVDYKKGIEEVIKKNYLIEIK